MDWVQRFDEVADRRRSGPLIATLYRSGPYLVIEIERDEVDDRRSGMVVREAAMALQTGRSVLEVADASARWIRSLSGFDRVMVYRFDDDWNGEVIAERKREDLNTFLGLHYPASDIPAQARELYRRNWLRLIPDVDYDPVPLVPPVAFDTARPLDLSSSTLRSVSPIHIEYLGNMGVGASMSVSIVINGELWGLIACHHYAGPHHVSVPARNAAEFLAQLISLRISETLEADARSRTIELTAIADHVAQAFAAATQTGIDASSDDHEAEVLALAGATGLVLRTERDRQPTGRHAAGRRHRQHHRVLAGRATRCCHRPAGRDLPGRPPTTRSASGSWVRADERPQRARRLVPPRARPGRRLGWRSAQRQARRGRGRRRPAEPAQVVRPVARDHPRPRRARGTTARFRPPSASSATSAPPCCATNATRHRWPRTCSG